MKYGIKILLILLLCFPAFEIYSAENIEFIINDEPFIFKGEKFIQGESYTRKSIENKLGIPDWYEPYPYGWSLSYDEKIILHFNDEFCTRKNSFCGFLFLDIKKIKGLNIYGLIISNKDNYSTILKQIEKNKMIHTVVVNKDGKSIEIKAKINSKFGNTDLLICCSDSGMKDITSIGIWYREFN